MQVVEVAVGDAGQAFEPADRRATVAGPDKVPWSLELGEKPDVASGGGTAVGAPRGGRRCSR